MKLHFLFKIAYLRSSHLGVRCVGVIADWLLVLGVRRATRRWWLTLFSPPPYSRSSFQTRWGDDGRGERHPANGSQRCARRWPMDKGGAAWSGTDGDVRAVWYTTAWACEEHSCALHCHPTPPNSPRIWFAAELIKNRNNIANWHRIELGGCLCWCFEHNISIHSKGEYDMVLYDRIYFIFYCICVSTLLNASVRHSPMKVTVKM